MTRQVGNELDEFVTEALRNQLLGLPLDLATLNMARARDTGIPTLNAARRSFFATSGNSALAPYESWADFGFSIKHPKSLVNFIAAYGTHPTITRRDHAGRQAGRGRRDRLRRGRRRRHPRRRARTHRSTRPRTTGPVGQLRVPQQRAARGDRPRRRVGHHRGHSDWVNGPNGVTNTGVDRIDLWVGGLAEKQIVFGGLLGPTFNYVFEAQMEDLQFGDRFYYLSRTAGLNMLTQLEGNSFAELIQRNTDVEGLPADSFSRPALHLQPGQPAARAGPSSTTRRPSWNESTLLTRDAERHDPLRRPGARRLQRHRRQQPRLVQRG